MKKKGLLSFVCGVQPVRVIYGDGEVLYLPPAATVEEVLQSYPHHFVCKPGLSSNSGGRSNQMLPLDAELLSGCIYFLLPVPRLFPAAPSTPSQCRCYANNNNASTAPTNHQADEPVSTSDQLPHRSAMVNIFPSSKSPLKVYSSPQRIRGFGSPFRSPKRGSLRLMLKGSKSKVLPESNLYSAGRMETLAAAASSQRPIWRTCPWRPRLGCISEEDGLELALEELRYHGFMRRREPGTAAAAAKTSPAKLPPPRSQPSKSVPRILVRGPLRSNRTVQ